jgi:hypothetical protein
MISQAVNNRRPRRHGRENNGHSGEDRCPYCGAPATDATKARIASVEQARIGSALEALRNEFSRERTEAERHAKAAIEKARRDAAKAAEKEKVEAISAERARFSAEKVSLEAQLAEVQRRLQRRRSIDLGDEAEFEVFELLKAEFPNDHVERVKKGKEGADILHRVIGPGKQIYGTIIYDVKNTSKFLQRYVSKLRADQLREQADHALLITRAFSTGSEQVACRDNVIILDPGRATAVVALLRRHLLQLHLLKLGGEGRQQKSDLLYDFMTSPRASELLGEITNGTNDLRTLDHSERASHEKTWARRSELLRSLQSTQDEFSAAIDRIIGTADSASGVQL